MFQFLNDHCVEEWDNLILSGEIFDFVLRIDVKKNTYLLEYIKKNLPYSLEKEGQYDDFLQYLQNMLYSNTEGGSAAEFSKDMSLIRIIGALSVYNSYSVLCKMKMGGHICYKRMLFYYARGTDAGKGNDINAHIDERNILAFCEDVTAVSDFISRYEDVTAVSEFEDKRVIPGYSEIRKQKEELKVLQNNIIYLAHEIRTPVNSIYGNLCILKMKEYQNNKYLGSAIFSAEYLLQLVNGILNIAEFENDKYVRKIEAVTLEELLKYPKGIFEQMAADKNIELQFLCDKPVYRYLYLNRELIQQILINLISNAIKYTDGGGKVFCRISEEYLEEKRVKFLLEVTDTGIGMEEDFLFGVFSEKNSSAWKDYAREYRKKDVAGSGLGLFITRRLVELVHGSIKIVSRVESGTKILVELETDGDDVRYDTYCLSEHEKKKANTEKGTLVRRVLVAEDEDANMEIMCKYLDKLGIEADKSYSGDEVVDFFARSMENYYDMILMDINMPDKSGIEAVRTIRGLDRKDNNLPIIAVTAHTSAQQKEDDLSAEINGYITKPYRLEDIISALSKYQR